MFEKDEQLTEMLKEEPKLQRAVRDIGGTVNEITKALLNDYEAPEQKEILLHVKANITKHYEELRQNHIRGAEQFSKYIEVLQA